MLLTMDHCEVATKRTKDKPHRHWENAQLVPSIAYLIGVDAENGDVQWNIVTTDRALRCFIEENHIHYNIVSMYLLEAAPDEKTKLRLVEITAWHHGIVTITADGKILANSTLHEGSLPKVILPVSKGSNGPSEHNPEAGR